MPKTTVPNQSRLDIAWTSEVTTVDNPAVGYRYKLDEPEFVNVGATTTRVSYNTGPEDFVGPGAKAFRLRAVDRAGGAHETSRIFQMNIPPTTGAMIIGTRLTSDNTVKPIARRVFGSASPITAKIAGEAMLCHAIDRASPTNTTCHDGLKR